jgi:hypothetical protein
MTAPLTSCQAGSAFTSTYITTASRCPAAGN